MPQPTTLIVAAGLAIVGAAIGVNVGRSTLDQINPADFRDSDQAFGQTLPTADWAQLQAQEYEAATKATAPAACVDCAWPVAPVPPQDPIVARYDRPTTAVVPQARAEAPVRIVAAEPPPEPDWSQVERYAHYPVEQSGGTPAPAAADGTSGGGGDDRGDDGTQ